MSFRLRRIVYLIEMLRKGYRRGTQEICQRLEIAPRTLFQDIRFIREELEIKIKYDRAARYYYACSDAVQEIDVFDELAKLQETKFAVIRFDPSVSAQVQETKWHRQQQIKVSHDGHCKLTIPLENFLEIKRFVLMYGSMAEILQPLSLRRELQKELQVTLMKYWVHDQDCDNNSCGGNP